MDPVLATILIALIDNVGTLGKLLAQAQSGAAVTPEMLASAKAQTSALMDQLHALLPPAPPAPEIADV